MATLCVDDREEFASFLGVFDVCEDSEINVAENPIGTLKFQTSNGNRNQVPCTITLKDLPPLSWGLIATVNQTTVPRQRLSPDCDLIKLEVAAEHLPTFEVAGCERSLIDRFSVAEFLENSSSILITIHTGADLKGYELYLDYASKFHFATVLCQIKLCLYFSFDAGAVCYLFLACCSCCANHYGKSIQRLSFCRGA